MLPRHALVHTGSFGNISHGCSSVIATRIGLALADYCITEAGFSEELGAQKFFDILCRSSLLKPDAIVAVVNIRDLRHQGGMDPHEGEYAESVEAVKEGLPNLHAHLHNLDSYFSGQDPTVLVINRFPGDSKEEIAVVKESVEEKEFHCVVADPFSKGVSGMQKLIEELRVVLKYNAHFRYSYNNIGESQIDVFERVEFHCKVHYGITEVLWPSKVRRKVKNLTSIRFYKFPRFNRFVKTCVIEDQYLARSQIWEQLLFQPNIE